MEACAERAQAFITGIQANVSDAVIADEQEFLGVIDAQPSYELVRCLMERFRKQAMEIERRQSGERRGIG